MHQYTARSEAVRSARMCYPDQVREDRLEGMECKRVRIVNNATGEIWSPWKVS